MRRSVVLPEPEGPRKAMNSWLPTSRVDRVEHGRALERFGNATKLKTRHV
jgi:hypothetical protein